MSCRQLHRMFICRDPKLPLSSWNGGALIGLHNDLQSNEKTTNNGSRARRSSKKFNGEDNGRRKRVNVEKKNSGKLSRERVSGSLSL